MTFGEKSTRLDFTTIRKPINLADYSDKKLNVINKKQVKDQIVRAEYPDAEICTLTGEEKLTQGAKAVDTAIWLLTPLIDMVKLAKGINNLEKEFYLVTQDDRQFLVVVTDEYIESRELIEKITEKKFEIGNWKFRNSGPIKFA